MGQLLLFIKSVICSAMGSFKIIVLLITIQRVFVQHIYSDIGLQKK